MSKLIVEIPDALHRDLEKRAAAAGSSLEVLVTALLHEYVAHASDEGSETGLCGAWQDDRTAGEIVRDIRSNRR